MQRRRVDVKRLPGPPTWAETSERRLGLMERVATAADAEIDAVFDRVPTDAKRRIALHYVSHGADPRLIGDLERAIGSAPTPGAVASGSPSFSSTESRSGAARSRHIPLPRLPRALWQLVLQHLAFGDMTVMHMVSRACRTLVRDPTTWFVLRLAAPNQLKWLSRFAPDLTRRVRALNVCVDESLETGDDASDGDEAATHDDSRSDATPRQPSALDAIAQQTVDGADFSALRALHVSGDFLRLYRAKSPDAEATVLRVPELTERLESLRDGIGYVMVAYEFRLVGLAAPRLESLRVHSRSDRDDDMQYWVDLQQFLGDSMPTTLVDLRLSHSNRSESETEPFATGPYLLNADRRRSCLQTGLESCVVIGWRYWCAQASDTLYDASCAMATLVAEGPLFAWPPTLTSLSLTYDQLSRKVEWSPADVDALSRLPLVELSLFVRPWYSRTIVPDWLLRSAPRRLAKIVLNCDIVNKQLEQNGEAMIEWMSGLPALAVVAVRELAPEGHVRYPLLEMISAAIVRDGRKFPRLRQLHASSDFMRRCRWFVPPARAQARRSDAIVCDAWCVCDPDDEIHSVGFAPLGGATKRRAIEDSGNGGGGGGGDAVRDDDGDKNDGDLHFAIPRGYRCVRFRVGVTNRGLARLVAVRGCIVTATVSHEFDDNLYATPLEPGACYYASSAHRHADAVVPGPIDDASPLLSSPYHEERDLPQPCYCAAPRLEQWRTQALSRYSCPSPTCVLHDADSSPEDVSSDTSYHLAQLIHLFALRTGSGGFPDYTEL